MYRHVEGLALEISSPRLYSVPAGADVADDADAADDTDAADSLREQVSCREELRVRTVVSSCWRSMTARASEVLRSLGRDLNFRHKQKFDFYLIYLNLMFKISAVSFRNTSISNREFRSSLDRSFIRLKYFFE